MNSEFSSPVVVVRPTLPSDRVDVLEFCKRIWDRHDYVPYVFDDWLADPHGEMFTAVYAGHAVGLGRLTHLAPGQWWLEGLRVDPDYQDKKIASQLMDYLYNHWIEHGDGTVRLWTSSQRVKVHHLCERYGFVKMTERALYTALPITEASAELPFAPVAQSEIPAAVEFALRPESQPLARGMMDMGWQVEVANETSIQRLMNWSNGHAFWWRGREALVCTWEDDDEDGNHYAMLALVACDESSLPGLLTDVRRHAARSGYHNIAWHAPFTPDLDNCLKSAGFSRRDEESLAYQYEKMYPTRKT
jgi:GNAT superfamily N-acetyltransferase